MQPLPHEVEAQRAAILAAQQARSTPPGAVPPPAPPVTTSSTTMAQLKEHFKASGRQGVRYAKGFGMAGALFVAAECTVEKYRGRTDIWNSVIGGCAAGAALAANGGPQAAAAGCGSFALFSAAIEMYMDHDK